MMQKQQDWYDEFQPLFPEEDALRTERILKRVTEQLPQTAESEKITMKKRMLTRRIRPLIFAAAAVAVGAVSMIAANAATDGAVVAKLTAYINGEPQEVEGRVIQEDDSTVIYEFEVEDEADNFMFEIEGDAVNDETYTFYDEEDVAELEKQAEDEDIDISTHVETSVAETSGE